MRSGDTSAVRSTPSSRPRLVRAICLVTLLLAGTGAAGCIGNPGQYTPACLKLSRRPPVTLEIAWVAPEGFVRRTLRYRHSSLSVAVREPAGLTLGIGNPSDRWCRLASAPELEPWITNAEILRREFQDFESVPESHGELLVVSFTADTRREVHGVPVASPRYAEVADLTPAALEAARKLSCLARATFGALVEDAIVELTPDLAARVGYPAACADSEPSG